MFVFEEPYLGSVVEQTAFDLLYDEHSFVFSVRAIKAIAESPGSNSSTPSPCRCTAARCATRSAQPGAPRGSRRGSANSWPGNRPAARGALHAGGVRRPSGAIREDLSGLLGDLHAQGKRMAGYGAPAKITTVTNYCGIGPEHGPVRGRFDAVETGTAGRGARIFRCVAPEAFAADHPDYAVLFAWNHAEEIMAKERAFPNGADAGFSTCPTCTSSDRARRFSARGEMRSCPVGANHGVSSRDRPGRRVSPLARAVREGKEDPLCL